MSKIPSTFGSGGSGLPPHGGGEPNLATILREMADDINVAAVSRAGSLVAIATADATDQASTNTLANAEKAKYNGELTLLAQAIEAYFGSSVTVADLTAITTVDASGGTTAPGILLLNVIKARYNGELLTLLTQLLALTPTATAPIITAIATADASDLATSEALAIAIKGKYNGELLTLLNNLKTTIAAFVTKTRRAK